jgi:hypothetical protein
MKKCLILFFLLISVQNIFSQTDDRWHYLTSDNLSESYIDILTIKKESSLITFWQQDKYLKPQADTKENGDAFLYDETRTQQQYQYEKKQLRWVSIVYYYENEPVYTFKSIRLKWTDIVPDTNGELISNYAFITAIFQESKKNER